MERIKQRFTELSNRPIAKVAEAKGRKKRRLEHRLDKAKQRAAAVTENEDMSDAAKARAVQKLFKKAELKRPGAVYAVASKGKVNSGKGGKKGAKVKLVDRRMKKDARATGNRKKKRSSLGGSKNRRSRRAK